MLAAVEPGSPERVTLAVGWLPAVACMFVTRDTEGPPWRCSRARATAWLPAPRCSAKMFSTSGPAPEAAAGAGVAISQPSWGSSRDRSHGAIA
jgi:hypothetical protein